MEPGVERTFEVLRSDEYRFAGEGEMLVDGTPFAGGRLNAGVYTVRAERGGRILLRTPEPWPEVGEMRRMYF